MAGVIVDVTGRVARLYQGAPGEFVAARNVLARDLVRAGQRDLATRVRSLTRPPASAWLVNQLYWHDRGEYDALLAAGAAARNAQQARLHGGASAELVRALAERDAIVHRLANQAERLAAAGGVALSNDTRGRIRTTLEAIALRAGDASLQHGQLGDDVALPGLEALAGLTVRDAEAPVARAPLTLVRDADADDTDRAARDALDAEIEAVRLELARTVEQREALASEAEAAEGALAAARQQIEVATRALETARQRLDQATDLAAAAETRAAEVATQLADVEAGETEIRSRQDALEARLQQLAPAPRRPTRRR